LNQEAYKLCLDAQDDLLDARALIATGECEAAAAALLKCVDLGIMARRALLAAAPGKVTGSAVGDDGPPPSYVVTDCDGGLLD
jgi:hypothetical protein